MLIKLTDRCYVAADQIAEIKVADYGEHITVRTKDGIDHCHYPAYRGGVYEALDRLVAEVNAACAS